MSLFCVIGYFSIIKAFSFGEASKIIILNSSTTITTIIAGILILKERRNIPKTLLAGLMVLIGVILLK